MMLSVRTVEPLIGRQTPSKVAPHLPFIFLFFFSIFLSTSTVEKKKAQRYWEKSVNKRNVWRRKPRERERKERLRDDNWDLARDLVVSLPFSHHDNAIQRAPSTAATTQKRYLSTASHFWNVDHWLIGIQFVVIFHFDTMSIGSSKSTDRVHSSFASLFYFLISMLLLLWFSFSFS